MKALLRTFPSRLKIVYLKSKHKDHTTNVLAWIGERNIKSHEFVAKMAAVLAMEIRGVVGDPTPLRKSRQKNTKLCIIVSIILLLGCA
jgi:hypothetical protein